LEPLEAARQARPDIDPLVVDLETQLKRAEGAAVITLVGATGAGKSSLLNALVGADVARPGTQRPTTSAPVIYRPRDADVGQLVRDLPGAAPTVVDYDPAAGGLWSEQILVDAPDTNSVAQEHREVVRALAERSDVLVVVAHRQSVAELASASFVDDFAGRRGLLFVLGRGDELATDSRAALVQQLQDLARERWGVEEPRVHVLSPTQARVDASSAGWREFVDELQTLVQGGRLGRVRRHNALGTLERLEGRLIEVANVARPRLAEAQSELEAGLGLWCGRIEGEVRERLELRRPDLAQLLWNEVGRRWEGPGGLAVRAGGLATLGLGAGALIARRNPLLAAGAAATAVVADRARGALQERSFGDTGGLLPGPGELRELEAEVLGGARLAAKRAGDVGLVPSAESLGPRAAEAVAEAWQGLVERDVPATAARSAPFWLRWVVDCPVYAFGAWIVYCAGKGFWQHEYVGLDFLVNAVLLLGAWLLVARSAVRMWLRTRAEGLLQGVQRNVSARLAASVLELNRDQEQALERPMSALERLVALQERWQERLRG
jgi:energy-coupling factor transporter ATP-binding protein EcfA2